MSIIVAADTGGTFTDLAGYDRERRRIFYSKSLTTYGDLTEGVMDCVRKAQVDLAEAEVVKFGTTLVINTYLQRNGARTALVTTRGFRDVLEIRRGNRPTPFDLRYMRDPPLVPRDRRLEASERIDSAGKVEMPISRAELEAIATRLAELQVEAVAVSFLNAYTNSEHEDEAVRVLRASLPGVFITAGTELSREWYEYERTSTAAANAYVGPRMGEYVSRLEGRLRDANYRGGFFLMASNGGVFSAKRAARQPVMLVESGPVGGCIGAGAYARALGLPKAIAFDMGGTTAKCALLEDGVFDVKSPYYVGGLERGFPVCGAVLDVIEVGTGGGSIAWLDTQGRLSVGPRSAGSSPGPICYGRGGTEPTVTDANLVLGRIGESSFLGGEMTLDGTAAAQAIAALAARLGLQGPDALAEMAEGILTIASLNMATAIKRITLERGLDPRDFTLFAFGGGGPLHGATLARELGIPELIVPPEPGIFSALGMVLADARLDNTQTFLRRMDEAALTEMQAMFARMEAQAAKSLHADTGAEEIVFERHAELRFRGQRHSLRTPIGRAGSPEEITRLFETTYEGRYGHVDAGAPVEFVSLVLTALARIRRPDLDLLRPVLDEAPMPAVRRTVHYVETGRLETPILRRRALPVGFAQQGPAVIEEYGSTTVVGPSDSFEVGPLGELRIRFEG